jgi:hypothetical protein
VEVVPTCFNSTIAGLIFIKFDIRGSYKIFRAILIFIKPSVVEVSFQKGVFRKQLL